MRYHEEQRFAGGWRWFWAGVMLGPGAIAGIVLVAVAAATGTDPTPALLIVAGVELVLLAGLALVLRTTVDVRVTAEGVHVRGGSFFGEDIPAAELAAVEEVPSGLLRRYGAGVGKRYVERLARYTVGDDAGVVVERSNGWRIVIGSKRPTELAAAIRDLIGSQGLDRPEPPRSSPARSRTRQ